MTRPRLELVSLQKEYDGDVVAVDNIDLAVGAGETVALLGPSGCGKSTTLNMIVGLEEPTGGDIQIDGKSVVGVPPGKRDVGLVFQDYAIFTSMSVCKNIAFGLQVRGMDKQDIDRAVNEVAELLDMRDRLDARARDLGGSELQRVAIARTLVTRPSILLLDEPLSNLEADARLAMRRELRRLQSEIGITIIYVTHDQIEALSLADRIAVMRAGKILQVEETARIYDRPDHAFVAGFLGSPPMNLIRGELRNDGEGMHFSRGGFSLPFSVADGAEGPCTLGIRPESLHFSAMTDTGWQGQVQLVEPRGSEVVLTVDVASVELKVLASSGAYPEEGERVVLTADPTALVFFDGDTNRRIDFSVDARSES
jgi:multiple sugar transport system ATP-binding protein